MIARPRLRSLRDDHWRACSVAGWRRADVVVGLRVACRLAISRRRGSRWRGAGRSLRVPMRSALDAARIGIEHLDLEIAGTGNHFAAHRQASDMGDEIAAERLDFLAGFAGDEFLADHRADVLEAGARVGDEAVVGLAHDRRRLVAVVLVVDLADDLFDDVLDRHQAVGAAIFVDHQREMDPRGLHLRQQVDRPHRRRHIEQLADDVGVRQRHARDRPRAGRDRQAAASCASVLCGATRAFAVMKASRSRMWTMPSGSSRVSL